MKKEDNTPKTREQLFAEKAEKSYAICYSQTCPLRAHCLRSQLLAYVPLDRRISSCVNLNNPAMQTETCHMYRDDQPVRMPLGIAKMYYDMHAPAHCPPPEAAPYPILQPQALLRIPQRLSSRSSGARTVHPPGHPPLRLATAHRVQRLR